MGARNTPRGQTRSSSGNNNIESLLSALGVTNDCFTATNSATLLLLFEYKDGVRAKAIKLQNKFIVPGAAGSSSLGWVGVGCSLNEITVIWDTTPAVTLD